MMFDTNEKYTVMHESLMAVLMAVQHDTPYSDTVTRSIIRWETL